MQLRPRVPLLLPLAAALLALPPVALLATRAVDVPFYEEWIHAETLLRWSEGTLRFADLWAQYNESRKVVSRLIVIALAAVSGGDIRWQMWLSAILALSTAALLSALAFRTLSRPAARAVALLSFILIPSLAQWQNFLWGNQFICFIPALCVALLGLILTANVRPWARVALSLAIALVAALTFASGILLLPLAAAAVLMHPGCRTRGQAFFWPGAIAAFLLIYFNGYVHAFGSRPYSEALGAPALAAAHFAMQFGAPYAPPLDVRDSPPHSLLSLPLYPGILLLGLLGFAVAECRRHRVALRACGPWLLLAAYSLACAALVTLGRATFGIATATLPRYTTFTLPAAVATCALLLLAGRTRIAGLAGMILATLTLVQVPDQFARSAAFRDRLLLGKSQLLFCFTAPEASRSLTLSSAEPVLPGNALRLNRAGLLHPPIIEDGDIRKIARSPGLDGHLVLRDQTLSGSFTSSQRYPAVALALTRAPGPPIVFGVTDAPAASPQPAPAAAATYTFDYPIARVPLAPGDLLSAYAVDPLTPLARQIGDAIVLPQP